MTSAAYAVGAMPAHAGIESLIIGIHGFLLSSTAVSAAAAGALATVIGYGIAGAAVVGAAPGRADEPAGLARLGRDRARSVRLELLHGGADAVAQVGEPGWGPGL